MLPRFVFALVLTLGAIALLQVEPGRESYAAATCRMLPEPDPWQRLEGKIDHRVELAIIGTVVAETPIRTELRPKPDGADYVITPLDPSSVDPNEAVFQSRVRVEAVLKGDVESPVLELPVLSDVWQCGGGPRLHEGTTLLLLLTEEPAWTYWGEPRDVYWATGPVGGNVLFSDGRALLDDYHAFLGNEMGPPEQVLRQVGSRLNASEEAIDRALAAIGIAGAPQERDGGISRLTLLAIGAAALAALIALTLAVRFRRRTI